MKTAKTLLAILTIVLAAAYFAAWAYSALWFQDEIDRLYADAGEDGIEFLGPKPTLGNFPFVPEAHYTTGIRTANVEFLFPEMTLRGYPIPGMGLTASFPQGLSLNGGFFDAAIWSLDTLAVTVKIPERLPATLTQEDLQAWHDDDGKISVRSFSLTKQALSAEGKGFLLLDDALQPVFRLSALLEGHEEFIASQRDAGAIEPLPAAIAATILNGLGKQDEETGERIVPINISVKNRMLMVGPVQVLMFPEVSWDTRSLPGPRL